ncbi:MAG: hypothetical protein GC166_13560 [Alphaproteobacteria bacterium]|nr:hypothetical protein [Alphaproteobacteria bacterium]
MTTKPFSALAFALLLGSASMAGAVLATTQAAHAAAVRPAVGKPLQQAIDLAKNGNGAGALAKVKEAEGAGGLTSDEKNAIAQTREFIAAKTGAGSTNSVTGCKAKFANDYNARRYNLVVGEDADCLRKFGAYDYSSQVVVGQAYYLMGNYGTAVRMLRPLASSEQVLSLVMSAAFKSGDNDTVNWAAEQLVVKYNKPQYWANLLSGAERAKGGKDYQLLDVYRLRFLTGNMRTDRDYFLLAQLALQYGAPGEAVTVLQKGFDSGTLKDARAQRLQGLAKTQMAQDQKTLAARTAQLKAKGSGDDLVKLGEDYYGYGKYDVAADLIQAGIAKKPTNMDLAQTRLGMALLMQKKSDAAIKAFNEVPKTNANQAMIASLWKIYARAH